MTKSCSIVIPTYQRGAVVLDSVEALLALKCRADEILLVDQTASHPPDIDRQLQALHASGSIRWLRLPEPSIPHAMNVGLLEARYDVVLFLDDDILPGSRLVEMHKRAHAEMGVGLVAGMVLQPGQTAMALQSGESFQFNSDAPASILEFMGGNFSVAREVALELGGFDENFVGAAYRFEAEFAWRYTRDRGLIRYEPRAIVRHLAITAGGTRAHGHHLRTSRPSHSVGAYYELLRTHRPGWWQQLLWRPVRAIRTRHHLRQPWWIPITLLAECRGFSLALRLDRRGPKLIRIEHD